MFLGVLVRASTNYLVVIIMVESESLSTESLELIDSQQGVGHLGVNGLLGVWTFCGSWSLKGSGWQMFW